MRTFAMMSAVGRSEAHVTFATISSVEVDTQTVDANITRLRTFVNIWIQVKTDAQIMPDDIRFNKNFSPGFRTNSFGTRSSRSRTKTEQIFSVMLLAIAKGNFRPKFPKWIDMKRMPLPPPPYPSLADPREAKRGPCTHRLKVTAKWWNLLPNNARLDRNLVSYPVLSMNFDGLPGLAGHSLVALLSILNR